jgi:hypothetical protein
MRHGVVAETDMSQMFAALLGALVSVIFSGILLESYKRHRDLQGTASALAGEIYSIIHMSEKRRHAADFAMLLTRLEAGQDVKFPNITGDDPPKIDPVAEKHLDRVGLLPQNLPERIATFYTYMRGIRIDLVNLAKGEFTDPKMQAAVIRADLVLWADAVQLGNGLWTDLRTVAVKVWWLHAAILQFKISCTDWSVCGFIALKRFIQKLTGRADATASQSNTGSQATAVVTPPTLAQNLPQSTAASSFAPPFQELVTDVEAKIDNELPTLAANLGKNRAEALKHTLIDQYCGLLLERASRFLYGSQIDALIFINANNNRATTDEIKRFYDTGAKTFPHIYVNYSFEKWLAFMQINGILGFMNNIISATPIGKALIAYMQMRQYLVTRAPG